MSGKSLLWILCFLLVLTLLSACSHTTEIVSTPLLTTNSTVHATKTIQPPTDTLVPLTPFPTYTATVTVRHTLTPSATATPIPTVSIVNCPGAPATSLEKNIWVQVSLYPLISNKVRRNPGLEGVKIGSLQPGEVALIVDGPSCADDYAWWLVRSLTGLEGWTAEGDDTNYWLPRLGDAFYYDTGYQSATSKDVLNDWQRYHVVMAGTYSRWIQEQWTSGGVCIRGNSELHPMFPSPNKVNGPVGADPFYQFARPFYGRCEELRDSSETVSGVMFSLDGGKNYYIPSPMIPQYREDHTYTYEVIGRGYPLYVRLDDSPLNDNYGQIFVAIEKIE